MQILGTLHLSRRRLLMSIMSFVLLHRAEIGRYRDRDLCCLRVNFEYDRKSDQRCLLGKEQSDSVFCFGWWVIMITT